MTSVMVNITVGSARNIVRHLEAYKDLLQAMREETTNDVTERFFGAQVDDVSAEIQAVHRSTDLRVENGGA